MSADYPRPPARWLAQLAHYARRFADRVDPPPEVEAELMPPNQGRWSVTHPPLQQQPREPYVAPNYWALAEAVARGVPFPDLRLGHFAGGQPYPGHHCGPDCGLDWRTAGHDGLEDAAGEPDLRPFLDGLELDNPMDDRQSPGYLAWLQDERDATTELVSTLEAAGCTEVQVTPDLDAYAAGELDASQIRCVLCTIAPCSCQTCATCGCTKQARYNGCPRGCAEQ